MNFLYKLDGIGWAVIELEIDGKNYYGGPSYLTEPLHDLVYALLSLIKGCVPDDELKEQVTFKLDQEPVIDKWVLTCNNQNMLTIKIETFKNEEVIEGKMIFEGQCDIKEFVSQVIESMEKLVGEYGLIGYKETWYKRDFPIAGYLKLKNYVEGKTLADYIEEVVVEGSDLYRSKYIKELQQLNDIINDKI